MIITGYRFDRD